MFVKEEGVRGGKVKRCKALSPGCFQSPVAKLAEGGSGIENDIPIPPGDVEMMYCGNEVKVALLMLSYNHGEGHVWNWLADREQGGDGGAEDRVAFEGVALLTFLIVLVPGEEED